MLNIDHDTLSNQYFYRAKLCKNTDFFALSSTQSNKKRIIQNKIQVAGLKSVVKAIS